MQGSSNQLGILIRASKTLLRNVTIVEDQYITDAGKNAKWGGGGTGGSEPPTSHTFISRLPPFSVLLPSPVNCAWNLCRKFYGDLTAYTTHVHSCRLTFHDLYYFNGSKLVFQPKRKFSFARSLRSIRSDWEDVKYTSNIIWVLVFESILINALLNLKKERFAFFSRFPPS